MDVMLSTFQQGMEKTNAGYSAMRTLYKNSPSLVHWTTPLKVAGLLGKNPGDPSVDDVIEAGKHIKIVGPDGKTTDFSTRFFNNPTVESFREKEKGISAKEKHYGNVMLAYMGAFLSEKNGERFKNLGQGFNGMNPLDSQDYQVYLEMPDKSRQIIVDSATKTRRDALIDKIEASRKTMLSFPEEPRIPAAPKEKNVFRRFFAWVGIVKHSKDYLDSAEKRRQAIENAETYKKAKETLETSMNEAANDEQIQNAAKKQRKVDDLFTAKTSDLNRIKTKIGEVETLKNIVDSKAVVFTKGSVSALLDIIHYRPLTADRVQGEAPKKDVEAIKKFAQYKNIDGTWTDDAPIEQLNKFVTLVSPVEAIIFAGSAEKAGPDFRHQVFNNEVKSEYEGMVNDSKQAFKDNFGIEPTPENVQMVTDAFNLDKYVKTGIEKIDGMEYGKEDKLPRVDDVNVGDMTLLLMSAIKTVAVKGNLVPNAEQAKPQTAPVKKNYPALDTEHDPALESQPGPAQMTL